mmetsp:Transcript_35127/g.46408  ORF Transcript_35127/g.46408 Transcript_35127/m.46408 type:complete len:86 (-) Transcript_35127:272-529(-)
MFLGILAVLSKLQTSDLWKKDKRGQGRKLYRRKTRVALIVGQGRLNVTKRNLIVEIAGRRGWSVSQLCLALLHSPPLPKLNSVNT